MLFAYTKRLFSLPLNHLAEKSRPCKDRLISKKLAIRNLFFSSLKGEQNTLKNPKSELNRKTGSAKFYNIISTATVFCLFFHPSRTAFQQHLHGICGTLARLARDTCTAREQHLHGSRATLVWLKRPANMPAGSLESKK